MVAVVSVFKNKSVVTAFILGIIFAVFLAHAYMVYQTRALAIQNSNAIAQIVSYLKQSSGEVPVVIPASTASEDSETEE